MAIATNSDTACCTLLFRSVRICHLFYLPSFFRIFTAILECFLYSIYMCTFYELGLGGHIFFDDSFFYFTFALPWTACTCFIVCPKNYNIKNKKYTGQWLVPFEYEKKTLAPGPSFLSCCLGFPLD